MEAHSHPRGECALALGERVGEGEATGGHLLRGNAPLKEVFSNPVDTGAAALVASAIMKGAPIADYFAEARHPCPIAARGIAYVAEGSDTRAPV